VPISKASLAKQLQLHIGKMGLVSTSYTKRKEKPKHEQTGKAGLTANTFIKKREATEEKFRAEIKDKLGDAFNNFAMAATAISDTIDNLVNSVAELTATNDKQNEQIIKLTEDLKRALAGTKSSNTIDKATDAWANPNGCRWTCGYKVG